MLSPGVDASLTGIAILYLTYLYLTYLTPKLPVNVLWEWTVPREPREMKRS